MKRDSIFIYSDQYQDYKFNDEHPFNQFRVHLTYDLLKELKAISPEQISAPILATDNELRLFHEESYINAIKLASEGKLTLEAANSYGIGTEDTPMFPKMHEASSLIVGGTLKAVDLIMQGKYLHALNLGGGLHHGFSGRASGFCIYNDSSIAIKYIQEKYNQRVLYIDTDVHHGDGVQWAFYDNKDVCTLSIHETGRYLFPGTGNVSERGIGDGYGFSFNIPVDAFTEDDSWLETYETAANEIAEYFKPDILITQNGADSHYYDPLSHLHLTTKAYREIPRIAHRLAHKYTEGKWIAVGGGGYDIWRVVPRAWSFIWLEMMNMNDKGYGNLPKGWLERWQEKSPVQLPETWDDLENLYTPIPRKAEITEKNQQTLYKALYHIRSDILDTKKIIR